jgi:hypothetical protein
MKEQIILMIFTALAVMAFTEYMGQRVRDRDARPAIQSIWQDNRSARGYRLAPFDYVTHVQENLRGVKQWLLPPSGEAR